MSLLPEFIETRLTYPWQREMLHYLWVGVLATIAQYVLLIFCVEVIHTQAVLGSSLGYLLGGVVNYTLNRQHTFASKKMHRKAILQFTLVFIVAFFLNGTFLHAFQSFFNLPYLLAQIGTTALVLVWNYLAHKFWTFRLGTV